MQLLINILTAFVGALMPVSVLFYKAVFWDKTHKVISYWEQNWLGNVWLLAVVAVFAISMHIAGPDVTGKIISFAFGVDISHVYDDSPGRYIYLGATITLIANGFNKRTPVPGNGGSD